MLIKMPNPYLTKQSPLFFIIFNAWGLVLCLNKTNRLRGECYKRCQHISSKLVGIKFWLLIYNIDISGDLGHFLDIAAKHFYFLIVKLGFYLFQQPKDDLEESHDFQFDLGNDTFARSEDEAMNKFLEREFPEILKVANGESHQVIFIPDTYIFGDLTEKVSTYMNWKQLLLKFY